MKSRYEIERSRIAATAESLGAMALEPQRFGERSVLLTGEPRVLATANGRDCFLNSFRLLVKMVEKLTVLLPLNGALRDSVLREADRICIGTRPRFGFLGAVDERKFDAILCVGAGGRRDLPWTVVNSHGWLARVSSRGDSIDGECSQANPVGALAAACFGVAEVFKRLVVLRPERGEMSPAIGFSLYDYCVSKNPGPGLPREIALDAVLFGAGAIGNGIVYLLSVLPVNGRLMIVDRQEFRRENWGTCLLVGPAEMGSGKSVWAAGLLQEKLTTGWLHGSVEEYVCKCGGVYSFPKLVLNGLDNIEARRAVQGLWPDQIIDGAIGPTLCEVTVHPWGADSSCLRCDFEEPEVDAVEVQTRSTGLRISRLAEPNSLVGEADVEAALPERKEWLRARQGKTVCSVISEGVLATLAGERQKDGFEPSVPFVACLSSCMVVAEMVRYCVGWRPMLRTGVQFDSLVGHQNAVFKEHNRKKECECVSRRRNIELVRASRRDSGHAGFSLRE